MWYLHRVRSYEFRPVVKIGPMIKQCFYFFEPISIHMLRLRSVGGRKARPYAPYPKLLPTPYSLLLTPYSLLPSLLSLLSSLLLFLLHQQSIMHGNSTVTHTGQFIVMCYNYKCLVVLPAKCEEQFMQFFFIVGIEVP